jgi:hypothetical protein
MYYRCHKEAENYDVKMTFQNLENPDNQTRIIALKRIRFIFE